MANRFLNNIRINDEYTLPENDGSAGQAIVTDGSGNLSFGSTVASSAESSESIHITVKNTSGAQITKGTPVYVTGETGNSGKIEIAPADASDESKMPALGILESTLSDSAEGFCVQGGLLEGLVTDTIDGTSTTANDTVYIKPGGGLTMTKPTGANFIQNIAKVARVHASNGSLVVSSILRTNDVPTPLYIDHDNQRLGIGTPSPSQKFAVAGNQHLTGDLRLGASSSATGTGIVKSSSGVLSLFTWGDATNIQIGGSDVIFKPESGSERMRITSAGNVGIGTTSPTGKLFVGSDYNTSYGGTNLYVKSIIGRTDYDPQVVNTSDLGITISQTSTNTAGPDKVGVTLYNDDITPGGFTPMLLFAKRETNPSNFKAATAAIYSRSPLGTGNGDSWIDGELIFATAGGASQGVKQRMVIDKEGNVGIGVTNPGRKLSVNGSIELTGSDMALNTTSAAIRRGTAGQMFLDAPGDVTVTIDSNNNNTDRVFNVRKNTGTELFRVQENGNVGIGTTSPGAKLHTIGEIVGGTAGFAAGMNGFTGLGSYDSSTAVENIDSLYLRKGGTNGSSTSIAFASAGGNAYYVGSRIKHIRSSSNSKGHLAFETKGDTSINTTSERMRITDDGNIGIGTTDPNQLLTLSQKAHSNGLRINGYDNHASSYGVINITSGGNLKIGNYNSLGTGYIQIHAENYLELGASSLIYTSDQFRFYDSGVLSFGSSGDFKFTYDSTNDRLSLTTDDNKGFTMDNVGNVGIGTTSPGAKLEVAGVVTIKGSGTGTSGSLAIQDDYDNENHLANIGWIRSSGGVYLSYGLKQEGSADWKSTYSNFSGERTYAKLDNNEFSMSYAPAQNTAVGTVVTNITEKFKFYLNTGVLQLNSYSAGILSTNSSGTVGIASSGDLPGGPYLPLAGGTMTGGLTISNAEGYSTGGWGVGTGETPVGKILNSSGVFNIRAETGRQIAFGNVTNGEAVRIDSSGNVGIGTTSPSYPFSLESGTTGLTSRIYNTNTNGQGLLIRAGATNSATRVLQVASSDDTKIMTVNSNGRVGIGTTNPDRKLHVIGSEWDNSTGGGVIFENSSTVGASLTLKPSASNVTNGAKGWALYSGGPSAAIGDGNLGFWAHGTNQARLMITRDGNVGIGTASPFESKLQVVGRIRAAGGTSGGYFFGSEEFDGGFYAPSDGNLAFSTNNSERIRINSNGNVGIGTTGPSFKLTVAGGISAGGKVTYTKSAGSLNTTGYAVAGLTTGYNGASCMFTFTCFGHTGGYQKVVYSCYNASGIWYAVKAIDEGTNQLDIEASANGTTITFTFKSRSGTMSYTPRVTIEATGTSINNTYA